MKVGEGWWRFSFTILHDPSPTYRPRRTVIGPFVVTTRIGGPPLPSVVLIRSLTRPLIVTVIGKPTSMGPLTVPNSIFALLLRFTNWPSALSRLLSAGASEARRTREVVARDRLAFA